MQDENIAGWQNTKLETKFFTNKSVNFKNIFEPS